MNAVKRKQDRALLKSAGFRDAAALSVNVLRSKLPESGEVSLKWLSGTILTGLTGALLMAAVLYVSFDGKGTFSTPYDALGIEPAPTPTQAVVVMKTDRVRPIAASRSDKETIEASIRETVDGVAKIKRQPFERIRATLATSATALSQDIPAYDPVALLSRNQPVSLPSDTRTINTDIYGAEVEGEVTVVQASLSLVNAPRASITDAIAADFVRSTVEGAYTGFDGAALAYASTDVENINPLSIVRDGFSSVAENVSIVPRTNIDGSNSISRTERVLTVRKNAPLADVLLKNGFTQGMVDSIEGAIKNVFPSTTLNKGLKLRILFGSETGAPTQLPYRMSVYTSAAQHIVTVARTDKGQYVLGLAPPAIDFPEKDSEEIDVANLPSLYRSIFETGRKHDIPDATIERIIAMFAYDLDLTKKINAGDSVELLFSEPDQQGQKELLYVGLKLANVERHMYRHQSDDGIVDYFDENGQTGKKFLMRRPLQGGGNLRSNYGYRRHPIFKTYKLHTGVDLSAKTGTPIYASGDGVVKRAQWVSGYGRFVSLSHANGYETAYAHMTRIAEGMKPGVRVRQGQVIGYVGSTGYSTGPHLHFEIKINGRTVDPLKVRLPRDKALPNKYRRKFEQTIAQIQELMGREPNPINVAER
ncbi:M23 family metallopeptidase [uncultured Maritalea sp.]|uniref:M23 family metallopeptidase n=1 Tax=uncultured Maritalea sp. TaxID=757249 RepID=UPI002610A123|nr:M23 family metallopeptidase [uncultured Maritalea sp.]